MGPKRINILTMNTISLYMYTQIHYCMTKNACFFTLYSEKGCMFSVGRGKKSCPLDRQGLLENDQVGVALGVPAETDDVVAEVDGEVEHGAVRVLAFEADDLVVVVFGPVVGGLHQLGAEAGAALVGEHAVEPGVERVRLQF